MSEEQTTQEPKTRKEARPVAVYASPEAAKEKGDDGNSRPLFTVTHPDGRKLYVAAPTPQIAVGSAAMTDEWGLKVERTFPKVKDAATRELERLLKLKAENHELFEKIKAGIA